MYWIKKILIWISIAIIVGIAITIVHPSQFDPMMFIVLICIALFIGFYRVIFSRIVVSNRKNKIFREVIKKFGANTNPNGNPEFEYGSRTIFIDYGFDIGYRTSAEFVTSYVKTPEINSTNIVKFEREFEIIKIRDEYYVIFSSHWNYEGNTYQEQLSKNLKELNFFIKNIVA